MYCRHCGKELTNGAEYCMECGVLKGKGHEYCANCGSETSEHADVCVSCGAKLVTYEKESKSSLIAGLLGIFFGSLGVHRFYLGYNTVGVVLLVATLAGVFTCGISSVIAGTWGFVEGVLILCGKTIVTDANGQPLER